MIIFQPVYTPYRSIFDLDNRGKAGNPTKGIHEKMTMDTSQASSYSLYPDRYLTEVDQTCENDRSPPPCDYGVRTVFEATVVGKGTDNPDDPDNLTNEQMSRSIVFTFTDTACWTIVYNAYCPLEPESTCSWYGGSNFLFAGSAQQIIQEGETDCSPTNRKRRNLATTSEAQVEGVGSATLKFGGSRRRLADDGRTLQDAAAGQVDIGMSIEVTSSDDGPAALRTAGGCAAGGAALVSILGFLFGVVILLT